MCHCSARRARGRDPEGPEPNLVTPPQPRRPCTKCKLLWSLLTGCKLAQTQSWKQTNKKKKENTNIAQRELILRHVRTYWKSLVVPSPIKKVYVHVFFFCLCGKNMTHVCSISNSDHFSGHLNRNVDEFLAFQMLFWFLRNSDVTVQQTPRRRLAQCVVLAHVSWKTLMTRTNGRNYTQIICVYWA